MPWRLPVPVCVDLLGRRLRAGLRRYGLQPRRWRRLQYVPLGLRLFGSHSELRARDVRSGVRVLHGRGLHVGMRKRYLRSELRELFDLSGGLRLHTVFGVLRFGCLRAELW